jgi:asparagine synthetase B (glutamine-hydrolysing)
MTAPGVGKGAIAAAGAPPMGEASTGVRGLGAALDSAVTRALPTGGRCSVLFSGGVDSALIAEAASRLGHPTLVTVGLEGSEDVEFVRSLKPPFGCPSLVFVLGSREVHQLAAEIAPCLDSPTAMERSILVGLAAAMRGSPDRRVLCGQGADELFLGYAHFRQLGPDDARHRSESDLARLLESDWPRSKRVADLLGHELAAPFLDPEMVAASLAVPIADRLPGAEVKTPLRELAKARGIPERISRRPKRALQFSTGFDRALRRPVPSR